VRIDAHDVGFAVGGLVLVAGIGMLKIAAGVIAFGLLAMAGSYFSAVPDRKSTNNEQT